MTINPIKTVILPFWMDSIKKDFRGFVGFSTVEVAIRVTRYASRDKRQTINVVLLTKTTTSKLTNKIANHANSDALRIVRCGMRTVFAPSSSFVNVSIFANQKIVTYVLPAFLVHVMVLNAFNKSKKTVISIGKEASAGSTVQGFGNFNPALNLRNEILRMEIC